VKTVELSWKVFFVVVMFIFIGLLSWKMHKAGPPKDDE
jgi:hypothetical protein